MNNPETTLISELLKQGILITILALVGWTLWKRYDSRMKETVAELASLRKKFEDELLKTRVENEIVLKETLGVNKQMLESVKDFKDFCQKENTANRLALARNSNIMECLTTELKHYKKAKHG